MKRIRINDYIYIEVENEGIQMYKFGVPLLTIKSKERIQINDYTYIEVENKRIQIYKFEIPLLNENGDI